MAAGTSASVTTSSSIILPDSMARAGYTIINPPGSGQTVWINIDGGAAVAAPPCVPIAEGESYTWRGVGRVTAIASGAVTITVAEH